MYVRTYAFMYTRMCFVYIRVRVCIYVCFSSVGISYNVQNLKSLEAFIYSDSLETSIIALHSSLTGVALIEQERIFIHFVLQNLNELIGLITTLNQQN